jgi:glyoxylase-like metal-dependent hydrolase (beta-lactamase superfamily II)
MHADFDLLERETGLRNIDLALITHYHGDHLEYCNLLRKRYGTTIATTPNVAAVMAHPEEFRYPCTIDWYGLPFDRLQVDRVLNYDETITWGDTTITPMHLPGHCYAHTGYAIPWRGLRTVCTGDTLQYGSGPIRAELPILYNDTAWPDRGFLTALRTLARVQPQLVLGGHSHSFFDRDGAILRDWLSVQEAALPLVADLLADGDLLHGMTPPGYDAKRPIGDSTKNGSAHEAHARSRDLIGSPYRDDRPLDAEAPRREC